MSMPQNSRPKLTIGMAHFDDFPGLWPTIQALRMYHKEVISDCEILVVDNNPYSEHGKFTKNLIEGWVKSDVAQARYVTCDVVGTSASRDMVFREAAGEYVVCIDSHVLIWPDAIRQLTEYYEANPDTRDLLSGPMVYDDLSGISTHFDDVWRDNMWGIWSNDPRGEVATNEPFEIPAMGLGLFSCRKEAWLGFNPGFRGFGGEEFYIHHKFQQAGARCLCLPFLRWVHRFGRPEGVRYPVTLLNRVRNYVLGHHELKLPLDRVKEHFVTSGKLSEGDWNNLLASLNIPIAEDNTVSKAAAVNITTETITEDISIRTLTSAPKLEDTRPSVEAPSIRQKGCGGCPQEIQAELEQLYLEATNTPSDINEHCPKLRELSSQCSRVTEFGMRPRVSTVALLAGHPKKFVTYSLSQDPILNVLPRIKGDTEFVAGNGDSLTATIEVTDLLFIDTKHTAEHLAKELDKHYRNVTRYIALHDTQIYGEHGEGGGPGLLVALRDFLREHSDWSVVYHTQANHGFTVLSRNPRDKPKLPSKLTMATNFTRALAAHVIDGVKKVNNQVLESRLAICTLCDQRNDDRCALCGCPCQEKALWRSSECPLGKWPNADGK